MYKMYKMYKLQILVCLSCLFILTFIPVSSLQNHRLTLDELYGRLKRIDKQIETKQQINELNYQLSYSDLQDQDFKSTGFHKKTDSHINEFNFHQFLPLENICQVQSQNHIKLNIFRSSSVIYLAISDHSEIKVTLMSLKDCEVLSIWDDMLIKYQLQDKASSRQEKLSYFVNNQNKLCVFDAGKGTNQSIKKHPDCYQSVGQNSIGGISRTKSSQGGHSPKVQLYIAYQSGQIRKYDSQGSLMVTISSQSTQNHRENAIQIIDHHPNPLIVHKKWIYSVDTQKHTQNLWDCPYIEDVKKIYFESAYSSQAYILCDRYIYMVELKNNKKKCQILKTIPLIRKIQPSKFGQIPFFVHRNMVFLEGQIYNMSTGEITQIQGCESLEVRDMHNKREQKEYFITLHCISRENMQKNTHRQSEYIAPNQYSGEDMRHKILIYKVNESQEPNYMLVWVVCGFIFVVGICFKFFKGSTDISGLGRDQVSLTAGQLAEKQEKAHEIELYLKRVKANSNPGKQKSQ